MRNFLIFVIVVGGVAATLYQWLMVTPAGQDLLLERVLPARLQPPPVPPPRSLTVFMCGTSSPLVDPERAQACVAVLAGERLFVVDAGSGSPNVLTRARLPLERLQAVLLTHFHSDHIGALGDLNLNAWIAGRPAPLEVLGPPGVADVVRGINDAYALDRQYRTAHHGAELLPPEAGEMHARTVAPGVVLDTGGLTVRAFAVDHEPVAPAYGYRFDYGGRSVVISGDTVVNAGLAEASAGADLLLADALSAPLVNALADALAGAGAERRSRLLRDVLDYHAHTDAVLAMARDAGVRQLALYHLVPPPQNLLLENVFRRGLPDSVVITEDGMQFELPADSRVIRLTRRWD